MESTASTESAIHHDDNYERKDYSLSKEDNDGFAMDSRTTSLSISDKPTSGRRKKKKKHYVSANLVDTKFQIS